MDALTGAGIALVTFALTSLIQIVRDSMTEQRAIAAELRADQRARRDAKLERMRAAFGPVLLAVDGLQTAAWQYFYSESGDPDTDSGKILETSLVGINDARARLWLEGEDVDDVAREVQRAFKGFQNVRRESRAPKAGAPATAGEFKKAFDDVNDGANAARALIRSHMSKVERSA